jgi:hypothetical protein
VERAEIVYLPSASALDSLRRVQAHPESQIAAFVDPVYNAHDSRLAFAASAVEKSALSHELEKSDARSVEDGEIAKPNREARAPRETSIENEAETAQYLVTRALQRSGSPELARLPASAQEGEALKAYAGGREFFFFQGLQATAANVRSLPLRNFGILHFALHAFSDTDQPDLSGLVFSMVDGGGKPQNGFLRGYEIAGLNLSAQLVVLSACETNAGKRVRGEGALSLARRFFDAGASRVLATRWKVDDRQTARLMDHFYQALLGEKQGPAAALRQAQLFLLQDSATTLPYYWAAFTLEGDWKELSLDIQNPPTNNSQGKAP